MTDRHEVTTPDLGIGTSLGEDVTSLKLGGARNKREVAAMIALVESRDIDTLSTRHMTHVGIVTGNDDTNSGLVIFHDAETKRTTQHVLPHGEGRKPKLVNSVIERNYFWLQA